MKTRAKVAILLFVMGLAGVGVMSAYANLLSCHGDLCANVGCPLVDVVTPTQGDITTCVSGKRYLRQAIGWYCGRPGPNLTCNTTGDSLDCADIYSCEMHGYPTEGGYHYVCGSASTSSGHVNGYATCTSP